LAQKEELEASTGYLDFVILESRNVRGFGEGSVAFAKDYEVGLSLLCGVQVLGS